MALELAPTAEDTAAETAMRDETPLPETPVTETIAAEPEKPAEPPKAAEPEAPKPEEKPKFVPHAAMHEERMKRQAAEKRIAELEAKLGPQQPEPAKVPIDPDTDPIAALKELREWQANQVKQSEEQRQLSEFDNRIQTHERDYSVSDPEYKDKIDYLWEWRSNQVKASAAAVGHTVTDAQIKEMLTQEIRKTAWDAFNNGKNPGEVFAALAAVNGYKPKAAAVPELPKEPEAPAKPTAEAESVIERISRGQRASRPTANAGGNPPATGELSMADLANLEGSAFDKAFEKLARTERAQRH